MAANLAAALSRQTDEPVLLVDANIASPALHRIFGIRASGGLVDILASSHGEEGAAAIVSSPIENLRLLPAGSKEGDSGDVFKSAQWASLFKHLKKNYHYVIVDLPALGQTEWAVQAAGLCDGVALVVEADRSPWEAVLQTKQRLLISHANILGVILNKRRFPVPKWLYRVL